MTTLYAIKHTPTNRFYTPNTSGLYRAGRNWRKQNGVLFSDRSDAENELTTLLISHRTGEERLRIRTFGGFDSARPEDSVGDGYVRDRDFSIAEIQVNL